MKQLNYEDVPRNWAICFHAECPIADKCLRRHAATLAPEGLSHHECVLPAARQDDGCTMYVPDEPVAIARGMTHIFKGVASFDVPRLRKMLEACFGSRAQYYRYRAGRFEITPEQQALVAAAFRKMGYTEPPVFDHTSVRYFFP